MDNTSLKSFFIFFTLSFASLMVGVDFLALAVAIDPLIKTFSINLTMIQWILTAFAIGDSSFLVSAGRLADIYDRKKIFAIGVFGFTLSSAIIAASNNIYLLIFMRFLQGISSGTMITSSIAIVNSYCQPKQRAGWISALLGFTGFGMVLGPLLGGYLVQNFSWRAIFLINVPFGIICLVLIYFCLPSILSKSAGAKLDKIGFILFTLTIGLITVTLSKGQSWGWLSPLTISCLVVSILLFVGFIKIEKSISDPMLALSLFCNRNFVTANFFGFVCYFLMTAWMIIFGFYLQTVLSISPSHTGIYFSPFGLALLLASPSIIKLSTRFSPLSLINLGFLISTMAFLFMLLVLNQTSILPLAICFGLFGLSYSAVNSCSVPMALSQIDKSQAGIGSGVSMMLRWLGSAVGAALITSLYMEFTIDFTDKLLTQNSKLLGFQQVIHTLLVNHQKISYLNSIPENIKPLLEQLMYQAHLHAIQNCLWLFIVLSALTLLIGIVCQTRK
ncbi:MAG: drug resistance transporter, EmrB/QacA subfamily [Gammaproteobacteria bacterium]|jgi:EmrB/QacA subfamily drug resistance transporter|nr:drug resistance transporter, EmrB/QacA subfamily [Gammaproteobacteria bacterium]